MSKSSNRPTRSPAATLPQPRAFLPRVDPRTLAIGAALVTVTLLAYLPVLTRGGFVWDDPDHILNNHTLRSFEGLIRMWTDRTSLPQWYPLTHTTFWIEYQWWGDHPIGYHVTNVLLHAINAILLWRLLTWLRVPGALLAAALFAVHPVMVESVAWITERKNVLSMLFYLLAMRVYLQRVSPLRDGAEQEDPQRETNGYAIATALFICALLSKTVTATLPASILVILWWKRGSIPWKQVAWLAPWFVIGGLASWNTSHLEHTHVGADPSKIVELQLSMVQRIFIAGRAIWFYAGKLVWPAKLTFIYPRWTSVEQSQPWLWCFPIAVIVALGALWSVRNRIGRGALAAVLIFCGTLVPALGFVSVYPMRFSFVADHFQYHASAALLALVGAIIWNVIASRGRAATILIPLALVAPLVVLTFHQSRNYESAVTLWRATLANNDRSWMVHTNLAMALHDEHDFAESAVHHRIALQLAPYLHDTHVNVGSVLMREGNVDEAEREFNEALRINPEFAPAYERLGQLYLFRRNDLPRAEEYLIKSLTIAPEFSEANYDMAMLRMRQGRDELAVEHFRLALAGKPDDPDARYELGTLLLRRRELPEAIYNLLEATRLRPEKLEGWQNLGTAQVLSGHPDDAIRSFRQALVIDPNFEPARKMLEKLMPARLGQP